MSAKNVDKKNRLRSVHVGFRMSPEEAVDLNTKVALSGLPKQQYIRECLLDHEVKVVCGRKVAREMKMYLEAIVEELQFMELDTDIEENVFLPLSHIVRLLDSKEDEQDGTR